MNIRPPKEIKDLKPGEARRIEEYYDNFYRNEYTKALERDGRIMLDLYMKMTCVTMYDKLQMTEDEIYLFLGHHRELFHDQVKRVRSGEQVDYLNRRMEEIFKTKGFPQGFFDKMLGSVETAEQERNGASVLNDSPVDCQTESVTGRNERSERKTMNKDKQIDYKKFARAMRENCCKDSDGNIVCTSELWELIASTIEGVAEYRKSTDVAEEIFAEIEKMLLDNHIGHYKTTIDTWCYNFNNEIISEIAELKKKYIGKDTNVTTNNVSII